MSAFLTSISCPAPVSPASDPGTFSGCSDPGFGTIG